MKKIKKIVLVLFGIISFMMIHSCSKDSGDSSASSTSNQGQFVLKGVTHSEICMSTASTQCSSGIDVSIGALATNGGFLIYNMPTSSSGSFNFGEFDPAVCYLFAGTTVINGIMYISKSGTLIKTGAKSFTFTCVVYNSGILGTPNSSDLITITGSGSY